MPTLTWASIGAALASGISAIFNTIVSTLKASYEASHKWFAVGCIIFALLLWFGYAHLPTFSSRDTAAEKQIAELTDAVKSLQKSVDALKAAPVVAVAGKKKR